MEPVIDYAKELVKEYEEHEESQDRLEEKKKSNQKPVPSRKEV